MRILLVEDTLDLGEGVVMHLRHAGHTVDWETDGSAARELALHGDYDLLILDIMLPGLDGLTLLRQLRQAGVSSPVLMLTARVEIDARVDALDLGADDYLIKPFSFRELSARARALLRRRTGDATNLLRCGALTLDRKTRSVTLHDEPLALKRREVTLLEILAARPGRIFSKDELMDRLFSIDDAPTSNAVEQVVARLRRSLDGTGVEVKTLRGLGYQLVVRAQ